MRFGCFILALAFAVPAAAQSSLPLIPTRPAPEAPPPRRSALRPVPFLWRELDIQRVNRDLLGRKNAARDEQRNAETPSLQPRPLSSW